MSDDPTGINRIGRTIATSKRSIRPCRAIRRDWHQCWTESISRQRSPRAEREIRASPMLVDETEIPSTRESASAWLHYDTGSWRHSRVCDRRFVRHLRTRSPPDENRLFPAWASISQTLLRICEPSS
jgi:hypothetical protein